MSNISVIGAPIVTQDVTVISMLKRVMDDPSVSIERVEQAFAFYQKVQADESLKAWTNAMVAVGAEAEQIKRDASNPQTHSKYASFEAIDAALRPLLSKHGLVLSHDTEPTGHPEEIRIFTYVMHISGHKERYQIDMPADGKGARGNDVMTKTHAVGSAASYGKRYNVGNAFNIATYRDDDGNAASGTAPVNTRAVVEQMPSDESAKKRDDILKSLRAYKTPLSPEDQSDFAEKFAAEINTLRKDDSEKIRTEYAERKKAK